MNMLPKFMFLCEMLFIERVDLHIIQSKEVRTRKSVDYLRPGVKVSKAKETKTECQKLGGFLATFPLARDNIDLALSKFLKGKGRYLFYLFITTILSKIFWMQQSIEHRFY